MSHGGTDMASIRKRFGKYQAQVRLDGFSSTKTFASLHLAKSWAAKQEYLLQQNRITKRKYQPQNFAEILIRYLKEVTPRKRSPNNEKIIIKALLRAQWMKLPLKDLSPSDVALYRDQRLEVVKPSTLHRQFCVLKHACQIASKEWEWDSPWDLFKSIRLPRIINKPIYRISDETLGTLLTSAKHSSNNYLKDIIILAIETAMRRGELLALEWKDFDQDRRLLMVAQSKSGYPRTIPLTEKALSVLNSRKREGERIFNTSPNAVRLAFERVRLRAGVKIRFHDLRHEAISRLFDMKMSIAEVQSISGHKKISSLFLYIHISKERLDLYFKNN